MKLKLDENLDDRLCEVLNAAGHDASSVWRQGLRGETDAKLGKLCVAEQRAMVTLDLDFADVLRFPPRGTPGIVVLRGRNHLLATMGGMIDTLIDALKTYDPKDSLWVVEPGRVRIHDMSDDAFPGN